MKCSMASRSRIYFAVSIAALLPAVVLAGHGSSALTFGRHYHIIHRHICISTGSH